MFVNDNNVTSFDSFGVKYIPKQIEKSIGNKYVLKNIYRIQTYDSMSVDTFVLDLLISS